MTRDELWIRARDEAGFGQEDAEWLEIPGTPANLKAATWAVYAGPSTHPDSTVFPLNGEQRAWSQARIGKFRVFTYAGVSDAAALGLMRWCLEYGRLERDEREALNLIRLTHVASQGRIQESGAGGAAYHHVAPEERQSAAAASSAVDRAFGPQLGQLQGVFGPLFRPGALVKDDVFVKRAVIFAAFHDEDLKREKREEGTSVEAFLADVSADAPQWYRRLREDDEFIRLSAAAPVAMPRSAETADTEAVPAELWRTAIDLYLRAERRALELLTEP